jgi:glycosyltransferase involved in cell wall biosynthesis
MSALRILTVGHSHIIALNRGMWRELARDTNFNVTVAAPRSFLGDLRPLTIEPEPAGSPLNLVSLDATWTNHIHVFRYHNRQLHKLMCEGGFDVVHAWEEPYIYAGYQIARALRDDRARFVFRTAQNLVKRYPPPFNYFECWTLHRAQAWIAGGNLVFETRIQHGYPKERGRVLSLAVDLAAFHPLLDHERRQLLKELGIQRPVIGFLGRLCAAKGVGLLMQALEMLPPAQPWDLLLLGSGPYKNKVEAWARARGWQDRVHIKLTVHDEVPRHLAVMDILVAPSQTTSYWREQFGRMIVEAFACGVPVIGSDSGEIPFVIAEAGRVVPERDAAAWATAILELLQSRGTRQALAARGLERAKQFSCSTVAAEFRDFYCWLAQQPLTL